MFKKYFNSIPQISILIILLGLIKQTLYYTNFKLPIKYYLGLSELGLLISEDLLLILSLFILLLLFLNILTLGQFTTPDPMPEGVKRSRIVEIFVGLFFVAIIITFYYNFKWATKFPIKVFWVATSGLLLILSAYLFFGKLRSLLLPTQEHHNIFLTVLLLSYFVVFNTVFEIIKTEHKKYKGTKIYTADSIYTSTDSNYFIGRTEKYVFIYNSKDTTTLILPSESITKMILKSK